MHVGRSLLATWGQQCFVDGLDLELAAPVGQKLRPPKPLLPNHRSGPCVAALRGLPLCVGTAA